MTKDEIATAIRKVDLRLRRLSASIATRPDAKLPEGEWTVRDALSHLAARSNSVPLATGLVESLAKGEPLPIRNIDEINHGQVEERSSASVEEIIEESHRAHQSALEAVAALDEQLLTRMVPSFRGDGEISVAELVLAATAGHENNHLDQIEQALAR